MTVTIARHGQTEWNVQRRYTGRADAALTAVGEQQAAAVGARLADRRFDAFFCSPQQRARRTATIIAGLLGGPKAPQPVVMDQLCEHDIGEWTGLTRTQIEQRWPGELARRDADRPDYQFRGGESYADLWRRAGEVVAMLQRRQVHAALLVAHAGIGRTIAAAAAGMTLAQSFAISFPNDVVYVADADAAPPLMRLDDDGLRSWHAAPAAGA